ncbi:hypothetical protein GQX73_g2826 [Xylaria multiplex]|uniref:Uncharacterized protein n=1 Tax=Xylaria multiplex TaxID=323545 RepID=A0A7C8IRX9_9PEZI|nr:hypothetical protein GQX73_g2826 [Xylaria multiplex]
MADPYSLSSSPSRASNDSPTPVVATAPTLASVSIAAQLERDNELRARELADRMIAARQGTGLMLPPVSSLLALGPSAPLPAVVTPVGAAAVTTADPPAKAAATINPPAAPKTPKRSAVAAFGALGSGSDSRKRGGSGSSARKRPDQGARRAVPCLPCVLSALRGASTGECHDASRGSRCWKCASGHSCKPLPPHALPVVRRFLAEAVACKANEKRKKTELDKYRIATRLVLDIPGEEFAAAIGAAPAPTPAPASAPVAPPAPAPTPAPALTLTQEQVDMLYASSSEMSEALLRFISILRR